MKNIFKSNLNGVDKKDNITSIFKYRNKIYFLIIEKSKQTN